MVGEAGAGLGNSRVISIALLRPRFPSEEAAGCSNAVETGENETVVVQNTQYSFDSVVGEGGHTRQHMCEHYIKPLVQNVCNGINSAVLAYGQTSSGKTYTMGMGKEQLQALSKGEDEAVRHLVVPYALRELFHYVEEARGKQDFTLTVTMVEIYMETYYDLLGGRRKVKTRTDNEKVMLVDAQRLEVVSMNHMIRLLQVGSHARMTKTTNQNDRSSRSHAILTIHVESRAASEERLSSSPSMTGMTAAVCSPQPESTQVASTSCQSSASEDLSTCTSLAPPPFRTCAAVDSSCSRAALSAAMVNPPLSAKLHLVDLAGSESVGRAGTVGLAAKEGIHINKSLMTLRNVIMLLADRKASLKVAPACRSSKLTILLRDALGGNSSTVFMACVSPVDAHIATTISTLKFGMIARHIATKPTVNIGRAGSEEVLELQRIILRLRNELEQLRQRVVPGSFSPEHSLRRTLAGCTSLISSSAIAASSLQTSMQLGDSSMPLLSHCHQQMSYLCSNLSAGRRCSVATVTGTPGLIGVAGYAVSSAGSVLGPANAAAVIAGRTTSPGAAQDWGVQSGWICSPLQQAQPEPVTTRTMEEPVETQVGGLNPCQQRTEGGHTGDVESHRKPAFETGVGGVQSSPDPVGLLLDNHHPGRAARIMHRQRRRKAVDHRNGSTSARKRNSPCTSGYVSPIRDREQLHRCGSSASVDNPSGRGSDSDSSSVLSCSSYDDSSDLQENWQSVAQQQQQRIMLLEAENEHLRKQVVHLSAVIAEQQAQVGEAHAVSGASTSALTRGVTSPGAPWTLRSSASGTSLLGQSMLTATTNCLQRLGVSMGGMSRSSRMHFSPSQYVDSPFSVFARPSSMRMSCGEGMALSSCVGPRQSWMGAAMHTDIPPQTQQTPMPHGSKSGGAEGSVESPYSSYRRYNSETGAMTSSASPPSALSVLQESDLASFDTSTSAAASRGFIASSLVPVPAANRHSAEVQGAGALAEVGCAGCRPLPQVAEEAQEGGDEAEPTALPCIDEDASDGAEKALSVASSGDKSEHDEALLECPTLPNDTANSLTNQPVFENAENHMLSMLSWIGGCVAELESQLNAQQMAVRKLLSEQGLTVRELPPWDTLKGFIAMQMEGVKDELERLNLGIQESCMVPDSEQDGAGPGSLEDAESVPLPLPAHTVEAEMENPARRTELLHTREDSLRELQLSLERAIELEAALELRREVQMLVAVYAGLSSSNDLGVATGPAVARAAVAKEQQLDSLRRQQQQQVIKDAAVARTKVRELEMLTGPPTPLEFGVLLRTADVSSSGCSATTGQLMSLSTSLRSGGTGSWLTCAPGGGSGRFSFDGGEEEEDIELERASGAVTPKTGVLPAGGVGLGAAVAPLTTAPPPLPPLPPQLPQQQTPSLLSQILPVLSPMANWRRGGQKDSTPQQLTQHIQQQRNGSATTSIGGQRRIVVQTSQIGPWLDALLDHETRLQQYKTVLEGALQERAIVYAQLQDVELDLAMLTESMVGESSMGPTALAAAAESWHSPASQGGNMTWRTEGGASFAGWMSSPMRAALRGAVGCVQQQVAALTVRQAKLQTRLEELCVEVANLQLAIVEAQESRSDATSRDDWWTCVPSMSLARPLLRMLLERAAEYRAAFQDATARFDRLEQQVEELGLQYQEAEARLAAHELELTATRAAALAAVAGPGLNQSFSDAVALLLQQQRQQQYGSGAGSGVGGSLDGEPSFVASPRTSPRTHRESRTTCLAAEALGAALLGASRSATDTPRRLTRDTDTGGSRRESHEVTTPGDEVIINVWGPTCSPPTAAVEQN